MKRMRVYCFLESLAQEILSGFRICNMLVDSKNDIIAYQTFSGTEKPQVPHNDLAFRVCQNV